MVDSYFTYCNGEIQDFRKTTVPRRLSADDQRQKAREKRSRFHLRGEKIKYADVYQQQEVNADKRPSSLTGTRLPCPSGLHQAAAAP